MVSRLVVSLSAHISIHPIYKDRQIQERKQNDTLLPDCGLLGRPIPVRRTIGNKRSFRTRIGNHATNRQLDCLCSKNSIGSTTGAIHSQHQHTQIPQANVPRCTENCSRKPQRCPYQQRQHCRAGIHPPADIAIRDHKNTRAGAQFPSGYFFAYLNACRRRRWPRRSTSRGQAASRSSRHRSPSHRPSARGPGAGGPT